MASLHNFVFIVAALFIIVWFVKTILRARSLVELWKSVKYNQVIRVDGLRSQNQVSQEFLQVCFAHKKQSKAS